MHNVSRTTDSAHGAGVPPDPAGPGSLPTHIGRYRVERLLGRGGFGLVYLAHDEQLQRRVAIKVAHPERLGDPGAAQAYLTEARTVARLEHPHIVPVHDAGADEQFPCYVVSRYIDGTDLAKHLKDARLRPHDAVELLATVAEALHYAHKQGLVHRDVKPGNILLDREGKPYVADFGLALREQEFGLGPRFAGTPQYMSPEQARGEGHRVDGRSDVFSLGVVLYQLLVGHVPFRAETIDELLEQITGVEVRPLRQIDDTVPRELERICLKCLAKRTGDRYLTARDLADDLRHFLGSADRPEPSTRSLPPALAAEVVAPVSTPATPTDSDAPARKIVPKGLRSFDASDADFFLELLPGPRDREGLPDSLRFWKTRIESKEPEGSFAIGLIYGPSGCGKSSLVKAGLLPRLAKSVTAVYVEATAAETELRLLKALRLRVPGLPTDLDLTQSLAALRRGRFLAADQKVVLFLDQFEQWLHARRNEDNTELVQALRQCDGGRLLAVVMVRDDFWLAVSRFMHALEVVPDGTNSRLVDLFDPRHARKVLAAFGSALGALPERKPGKDQEAFLDQAVAGLAQDGKVISVRLALFADMVKGKPWTPATLKAVGGTEGVGATFLEETFAARTAPPQHRLHARAAHAVLRALLPEAGTEIKGHMKSRQELLEASGYADRPRDFEELLRILDGEIRLITPTDPEGKDDPGEPGGVRPRSSETQYYQLTHDYLVPSLREWLTRKQKETRRGRAELLLADRAAVWKARPENRQLPSLLQWLQIRRLTSREKWTPQQRKMMAKAGRYHGLWAAAVAALLAVATFAGLAVRDRVVERQKAVQAAGLVQRLLDAETAQVAGVVAEMAEYRQWTDPLLRDENVREEATSRQKLHASLALLPVDDSQVDYLSARLLDAQPHEVPVIRAALIPHSDSLIDGLWAVAQTPDRGKESRRLRAAAALAGYHPESEAWAKVGTAVVEDLVRENPVYLGQWAEVFRPVRRHLLAPLSEVYRDRDSERAAERTLATNLLADYVADNPRVLADLLMDADEKQFAVIYPKFKEQGDKGIPLLAAEIDKKLPAGLPSSDENREVLAKRQANAAAALLRLSQPEKVWPLLKHSPDPRVRSYLIHRLFALGVDPGAVIRRLDEEPDLSARRALLLALGEFDEAALPSASRTALLPKVRTMYRDDADPGLHASAEWLLRQWQQDGWIKQVNDEWAKDREQREKRMTDIPELLEKGKENALPRWFVNGQGQTYVVIPGPVEFLMGSPESENDRRETERQHRRRIGRTFAIAAKSVTVAEYRRFNKGYTFTERYAPEPDCPVVSTSWYQAAAYCNWLSKQEGVPETQWCYEVDAKGQVTGLRQNYLGLTGYRLPTEAEMEYACRAGAVTSRYYGETAELLGKYAWFLENGKDRSWPAGGKKPNDLGLFDMHGNVWGWCQEEYKSYPAPRDNEAIEDKEDVLNIISTDSRVLRGGSFNLHASLVRSSSRSTIAPTLRYVYNGFRPSRTLPP